MNGSRMTICCSVSENFLVFHQHGLVSPAHSIPRVRFSYMTSPTFSHKPILKTYISHGQVYHSSDFTLQLQGFFYSYLSHMPPYLIPDHPHITLQLVSSSDIFIAHQLQFSYPYTDRCGKIRWSMVNLPAAKSQRNVTLSHPTATNCQ